MNEFKGTPPPWYVGEIVGIYTPIVHSGEGLGYCPPVLAKVTTRYSSAEQAKCNANLIAAAPELLEALQNVINSTDAHHSALEVDHGFDGVKLYQDAVNAINKALGEGTDK